MNLGGNKMRKIISLILIAVMICSLFVGITPYAAETNTNNTTAISENFGYKVTNGTAGITKYYGSATELTLPPTIDGYPVEGIYSNAFKGCETLESIVIPKNITFIASSVFIECPNIKSIVVEEDNPIYDSRNNCNAIIETETNELCVGCNTTVIPDNIKYISAYAFDSCPDLEVISIPDTVKSIGTGAFANCTNLANIKLPENLTVIKEFTFSNCTSLTNIAFPNNLETIESFAFNSCTGLENIFIHNKIMNIQNYAFEKCSSLSSVAVEEGNYYYDSRNDCDAIIHTSTNALVFGCQNTVIPDTVKTIKTAAFSYCAGLTKINIPSGVTTIESNAFSHCPDLSEITLSDTVTDIDKYGFNNCKKISSISIDSNNPVYDSRNNCNALILTAENKLVMGSNNTTIPSTVETIDTVAFYEYSGLETITIPEGVKNISNLAFYGCSNLRQIDIPDTVTHIGNSAFHSCSSLETITISDKVEHIEDMVFNRTAFYDNSENWENDVLYIGKHLIVAKNSISDSYTVKADTATIADQAFANCKNIKTLNIPSTVHHIGANILSESSEIQHIHYDGTQQQWKDNVSVNSTNVALNNAKIYFTDSADIFKKSKAEEEEEEEKGCAKLECTQCDYTYTVTEHSVVINEALPPTCGNEGLTEGKHCSLCNEVLVPQKVIPATGEHQMITTAAHEATCTKPGAASCTYCKICQSPEPSATPPLGHDFSKSKVTTKATCTKKGVKTFYCSRCDETKTEKIPAKEHNLKTVGAKKATYFEKGNTGNKVCKHCSKIIKKGTAIAKKKLAAPTVTATGSKGKFTVKYTKVKKATGYKIKYTIDKTTYIKTIKNAKILNQVFSNLKKGTYKIQVCATIKQGKKSGSGNWTKTIKVKVK